MAHNLFSRWRYRTSIIFSGCDQSVYQQDVVVHRSWGANYEETSGGLNVWHIYVGPNCRADYGDVRFSTRNGGELPYYLRPNYDGSSATFCVRLESADSAGVLMVWYGNDSAQTTSDGDATFLYFDNFRGNVLNSSKWAAATGGSGATVNDGLTIYNNADSTKGIFSTISFDQSVRLEYRAAYSSKGWESHCGFIVSGGLANTNTSRESIRTRTSGTSSGNYFFSVVGYGSYTITAGASFSTDAHIFAVDRNGGDCMHYVDGTLYEVSSHAYDPPSSYPIAFVANGYSYPISIAIDYVAVRASSATVPVLILTSSSINESYSGVSCFIPADDTIRFGGVGSIRVLNDEIYSVDGAGSFSIETTVRSPIAIAGSGAISAGVIQGTPLAVAGVGTTTVSPMVLLSPTEAEPGAGSVYASDPVEGISTSQYKFESITISRSIQDQMWQCSGQIDGSALPPPYRYFSVVRPDRVGTDRLIFRGFIPGRKYILADAAHKSSVQAYDQTYILTRQHTPEGELSFQQIDGWNPVTIMLYLLGEEGPTAGSQSQWQRVTGIYPYRIVDPATIEVDGYTYTPKDFSFEARSTKARIIQALCEYCGFVFLVKWKDLGSGLVPCAYFVHEDEIDDASSGLDLPYPVTFVSPHPGLMQPVRIEERAEERYNRITVRSSSASGQWYSYTYETKALENGDELPLEYVEERSDLGSLDLVIARAAELFDYYSATTYTYTVTVIDQTDLELYQIVRFSGYSLIPSGTDMRIISISHALTPTHTETTFTCTPASRLSDLRALLRNQQADLVAEVQTIAQAGSSRPTSATCQGWTRRLALLPWTSSAATP